MATSSLQLVCKGGKLAGRPACRGERLLSGHKPPAGCRRLRGAHSAWPQAARGCGSGGGDDDDDDGATCCSSRNYLFAGHTKPSNSSRTRARTSPSDRSTLAHQLVCLCITFAPITSQSSARLAAQMPTSSPLTHSLSFCVHNWLLTGGQARAKLRHQTHEWPMAAREPFSQANTLALAKLELLVVQQAGGQAGRPDSGRTGAGQQAALDGQRDSSSCQNFIPD